MAAKKKTVHFRSEFVRKPRPVRMLVGEDGDPRGMVSGYRVGPLKTVHGTMLVVQYVPVLTQAKRRKRGSP